MIRLATRLRLFQREQTTADDYEIVADAITEIESLTTQRDALLSACREMEEWWLREGEKYGYGAPHAIFAVRAALSLCPAPPAAVQAEPTIEQMRNEVMFCGSEDTMDTMPAEQVRWYWRQQSDLRETRASTPPCDPAPPTAVEDGE